MNRRILLRVLGVAVGVLVVALVVDLVWTTDEELLEQVVEQGARACEARSPHLLEEVLDESFVSRESPFRAGRRADLQRSLERFFASVEELTVSVDDLEIEVERPIATLAVWGHARLRSRHEDWPLRWKAELLARRTPDGEWLLTSLESLQWKVSPW